MRKIFPLLNVTLLTLFLAMACSEEEKVVVENRTAPVVSIRIMESTPSSLTLKFVLNGESDGLTYAVGIEQDRVAFENGTLKDINTLKGTEELQATVSGLECNKTYTVFARAHNAEKEQGPVAMVTAITPDASADEKFAINIEKVYATVTSLAVKIDAPDYYKFEYALGTEADRTAFENGTLEGIMERRDPFPFTVNYFDLSENTEYIFYTRAYLRTEEATGVMSTPVSTMAKGSGPEVTLSVDKQNLYIGTFRLTPNAHCSKFAYVANIKGERDKYLYSQGTYNGNMLDAFNAYNTSAFWNPMLVSEVETTFEYSTPNLMFEEEHELFILLYNEAGEPVAVQKETIKTPSLDPNAPEARISMEITERATDHVKVTITPNEYTIMTVYMSVSEDVLNQLQQLGGNAIAQFLWQNRQAYGVTTMVGNAPINLSVYADPGIVNYLIACPMNTNGPEYGMTNSEVLDTTVRTE